MDKDREKLLVEIIRIDPVIRKAEAKLRKLSNDPDVVVQYEKREKELVKMREERIMEEIRSLEFGEAVYSNPSEYQIRIRELVKYCEKKGRSISSLTTAEAMKFVERRTE